MEEKGSVGENEQRRDEEKTMRDLTEEESDKKGE